MDYFLNSDNVYERLKSEYNKHGKLIVAVDFDDTLYDFHNKGRSYDDVIGLLRGLKEHVYIIIYTASKKERYPEIKRYLKENQIPFDTINENIKDINVPKGGKLYYNILLDDRAGLKESYEILNRFSKNVILE
ncbi:MAG: hypothetical protein RR942_01195 [Romboutsia sp.]